MKKQERDQYIAKLITDGKLKKNIPFFDMLPKDRYRFFALVASKVAKAIYQQNFGTQNFVKTSMDAMNAAHGAAETFVAAAMKKAEIAYRLGIKKQKATAFLQKLLQLATALNTKAQTLAGNARMILDHYPSNFVSQQLVESEGDVRS